MNARRLPVLVAIILTAIAVWLFMQFSPKSDSAKKSENITVQKQTGKISAAAPIQNTHKFPADSRPEVQTFYRFAEAANLYNFDPKIIALVTNDSPSLIDLGTPTHGASIFGGTGGVGGKLHNVHSYFEGSDDRRKPEVADLWYQCTGTWTEAEAVAETYEILRKMGENELLKRLQAVNKHEFRNENYHVQTPDGKTIMVTPFPQVILYDETGGVSVKAEFRMGPNGPAGLTRWFCLY